jgi:hypothetical protein
MTEIKWNFPGNGHGTDTGLDSADVETFKKDTISSLAREMCQNSIDARSPEKPKVRMEFHSFKIGNDEIPGCNQIKKQIDACIDTWTENKKITSQLVDMKKAVNEDEIVCLRISDFNTTGLVGVSGGDNTPWHYLVHGSGLSDKSATSGGSKGIGKFATFVTSAFNTVFYSTNTVNGEKGYEGICKLCSAKQEGTTEKTQGTGYYGNSIENDSILGELKLDKDFNRSDEDYGTDVFIIGFKNPVGWKKDIVSKILDSFMAAIVYGTLEITVDDIVISADNLKNIVFNDDLVNKTVKNSVVSQYLLLTDETNRFEDTIPMGDYGNATLYLLEFDEEHEQYATNNCVMIRYPFMKIKVVDKITTLPCSAMCIIGDNKLNSTFRNIENPQHTNWEFNRIDDLSERSEVRALYHDLIDKIKEYITNHLASSDNTTTDLEGAGDYIPVIETEKKNGNAYQNTTIVDVAKIQENKIKVKTVNLNGSVEDENGNGVEVDIINNINDGPDETVAPSGHNGGSGGGLHGGDNQQSGNEDPNGHEGLKHADLRGMEYRFFCFDKRNRKYGVTFVSDYSEPEVYFELYSVDDSGQKDRVKILSCGINDNKAEVVDDYRVKFSIDKGTRYNISLITDQDDMFSGEVKIYAYR